QPVSVVTSQEGFEFIGIPFALRDCLPSLLHRPLGLLKKRFRSNWAGDGVKDASVWGAKICSHIAALLLLAIYLKAANPLEGGNEVLIDKLTHLVIRKSVHTERLGVVSSEVRIFEVARHMQHEYKLLLLCG